MDLPRHTLMDVKPSPTVVRPRATTTVEEGAKKTLRTEEDKDEQKAPFTSRVFNAAQDTNSGFKCHRGQDTTGTRLTGTSGPSTI